MDKTFHLNYLNNALLMPVFVSQYCIYYVFDYVFKHYLLLTSTVILPNGMVSSYSNYTAQGEVYMRRMEREVHACYNFNPIL